MAKIDLAPLPPFDPFSDPSSLSQRWKIWTKRFQTYIAAMNITNDKQKRALLLYQAGEATQEIFETLPETGEDYTTAQAKLDEYFSPKKNVDYQVLQFCQAVQQPGETVDQFVTRLRKLAATCEFGDVAKEIKSAVIQNRLCKQWAVFKTTRNQTSARYYPFYFCFMDVAPLCHFRYISTLRV